MPKFFFNSENCQGVTSGATGKTYDADRQGFVHVDHSSDIKHLVANGYVQAGGMPRLSKFWLCECGWEASISHCPKCDRDDLVKVEK